MRRSSPCSFAASREVRYVARSSSQQALKEPVTSGGGYLFYRHSGVVRITRWINAICLAVLLMSGLQISNAHPALYLGSQSHFEKPVTRG